MTSLEALLVGGKTVAEWDLLWRPVKDGLKRVQPSLRHKVGLYRILYKGQVVALGGGTDKSGGLAKRLSDFFRPSPSGRQHYAGQLINSNLSSLEVEVLIIGADRLAREIARQLKGPMIRFHRPAWSAPNTPFLPQAKK
jgi:hypothetical protein